MSKYSLTKHEQCKLKLNERCLRGDDSRLFKVNSFVFRGCQLKAGQFQRRRKAQGERLSLGG